MPEAIRIERSTRMSRWFAAIGLLGLSVLVAAPFILGRSNYIFWLKSFPIWHWPASWNLLAGYGGLVFDRPTSFCRLGGYSLFALTIFFGLPPILAVVLAGPIAALCAIPTGWIVFSSKRGLFCYWDLGSSEVYRLTFAQISALGGGSGSSLPTQIVQVSRRRV